MSCVFSTSASRKSRKARRSSCRTRVIAETVVIVATVVIVVDEADVVKTDGHYVYVLHSLRNDAAADPAWLEVDGAAADDATSLLTIVDSWPAGSAHVAGDVTSPQVESAATGSAWTYAVTGTVMLASDCASTAMTRSAVYGSVFSGRPSGDAYTGRSSCQSVERRPLSTSGRWIDAAAVSTVSQLGSSPTDHVGAADARSVPVR